MLPTFPFDISLLLIVLIPVVVWSYFWKALGLWFSARKGEKGWFIVFIFVNLAGILELFYLYSRRSWPFKATS